MKLIRWGLTKKLIVAFVVIILILMLFIIYTNRNLSDLLTQYNLALQNNKYIDDIFNSLSQAKLYFRNYIIYNTNDTLDQFNKEYKKCFDSVSKLKKNINDEYCYGKLIDFENMLETYRNKTEIALQYIDLNNKQQAYSSLLETERVNALINDQYGFYAQLLNKNAETQRIALLDLQKTQHFINLSIIICISMVCIIFAVLFIQSVTKPVKQLVKNAKNISKGNFDVPLINNKSTDEIAELASTFNFMASSLKYYIKEMKNKAMLQKRLLNEENKNLRTEALLKETKLIALQAKINPHFLFNTLNIIKQTAYLENAEETRIMIETTSRLLRFYLDKSGITIGLKEELENVLNYIFIQNKRFGKRMSFSVNAGQEISDIEIPSLIIQPLIENSIMHGLANCVKGGRIEINIVDHETYIKIDVYDNGKGIDVDTINNILYKKYVKNHERIGLNNVIQRLELFFGKENLLFINSDKNGTHVRIKLPKANYMR